MHASPPPPQDRAARVTPAECWAVVEVRPLPGYRLGVCFADGTRGEVDVSRLIHGEEAGVFAVLRDEDLFARVTVVDGAVTWPGELDLAPDAMYDEIKAHGRWVVE